MKRIKLHVCRSRSIACIDQRSKAGAATVRPRDMAPCLATLPSSGSPASGLPFNHHDETETKNHTTEEPPHFSFHFIPTLPAMSSPAGLHLQDLILDTKATASKEQKAEAVSEVDGRRGAMVLVERDAAFKNFTTARTFGWDGHWHGGLRCRSL